MRHDTIWVPRDGLGGRSHARELLAQHRTTLSLVLGPISLGLRAAAPHALWVPVYSIRSHGRLHEDWASEEYARSVCPEKGSRTLPGLVRPAWRNLVGGNIVVEHAPFQTNPEMSYGKMRKIAHRIREVDKYLTADGKFKFPLGERKDALARLPPGVYLRNDGPKCCRRPPG
jgi:hypothetical protein